MRDHLRCFFVVLALIHFFVTPANAQDATCEGKINCSIHTCGSTDWTCTNLGYSQILTCSSEGIPVDVMGGVPSCTRTKNSIQCGEILGLQVIIHGFDRDSVRIANRSGALIYDTGPIEAYYIKPTLKREVVGEIHGNIGLRCDDDVTRGSSYVSVRNGNNLDMFWFLGVSGESIVPFFARLQDGQHLGVTHTDRGPLISLGQNKDVFIQYCFDGQKWTSSDIQRSGARTDYPCNSDAISFFDVNSVVYSPPRPAAPSQVDADTAKKVMEAEESCLHTTGCIVK